MKAIPRLAPGGFYEEGDRLGASKPRAEARGSVFNPGHGVTPEEFESVVDTSGMRGRSRATGRPCCWGNTPDGRYVICVYEYIDEMTILPITAYEVRRPRR